MYSKKGQVCFGFCAGAAAAADPLSLTRTVAETRLSGLFYDGYWIISALMMSFFSLLLLRTRRYVLPSGLSYLFLSLSPNTL